MSDREDPKPIRKEFPLTLLDEKGAEIDPHAVAHDLTEKGFKVESRVELSANQLVSFHIGLDASGDLAGRGRVGWCQRNDLAYWAGIQFLGLSRGDRQRVRRVTNPDDINWNEIGDKAIVALLLALVTVLGWIVLSNPAWRGILFGLFPQAAACLVLGWSLIVLLKR